MRRFVPLLALTVFIASCGGDGGDGDERSDARSTTSTRQSTTTTTTPPTTSPVDKCTADLNEVVQRFVTYFNTGDFAYFDTGDDLRARGISESVIGIWSDLALAGDDLDLAQLETWFQSNGPTFCDNPGMFNIDAVPMATPGATAPPDTFPLPTGCDDPFLCPPGGT